MKSNNPLALLLILALFVPGRPAKAQFPHTADPSHSTQPRLVTVNGYTQLLVDGRPFLIRAGELGNSSASSMAYMKPVWPKLTKMHLNALLTPVYWELLEPSEGKFDFSLVDALITEARQHHLKLVLLWFGTWKNSMSCYPPAWVKTDQGRFPRARSSSGQPQEIITPFSQNALAADKKAFIVLMQHIRTMDGRQHTVLMVQIENEIGMLPSSRDHSTLADEAFHSPVPPRLIDYLLAHRESLSPELSDRWKDRKTAGDWEEVFGQGPATDEIFMSWYFGRYVQEIAAAGKAIYDIPMYVNAALNAPGKKPGEYPSAGPLPHVIDIWKAAAPAIDFLSPDFYNPNFRYWADRYTRKDNPLFIPEHRFEPGADAKALYAFGHYHAIGFSPFSIESTDHPETEPIGKCYDMIAQLTDAITGAGPKGWVEGVLFSKDADSAVLEMGDYIITAEHELTLGWSPKAKEAEWPLTGGIIIEVGPGELIVAGTGIVLTFQPKSGNGRAGILQIDEGNYLDGRWQPRRRMNGDQDHQGRHLRIPEGEYSIQRIKLYQYR
jgi:hypothetical protein